MQNTQSGPSTGQDGGVLGGPTTKRLYRACLHCRSRKQRCELGNLDEPSEPPCARCKRESRECIFAPSRRGGNNIIVKSPSSTAPTRNDPPLPKIPTRLESHSHTSTYHVRSYESYQSESPRSPRSDSPPSKRQRLQGDSSDEAEHPDIVVTEMQSEADALHLLSMASPNSKERRPRSALETGRRVDLGQCVLVRKGLISEDQLVSLVHIFFKCQHHFYPMVPSKDIPRTRQEVAEFAHRELHLLTAIVVVASRNDRNMRHVHDRSWEEFTWMLVQTQCHGAPPTIGLVEGLLLVAENLPRNASAKEQVHGTENRQAWMLIGAAIRCASALGIEKLAIDPSTTGQSSAEVERARLAWTYCYLFDRHVSLRLGMAFWSRGPSVCFEGLPSATQTGPLAGGANFPSLRPTPRDAAEPQEDFASLVQAYVELTQLMTNAQSCLYSSEARTRYIVAQGEYFKYLDELVISLDGFKMLWEPRSWNVFPLKEALWAMYLYTELYVCAFSFQAHVERAKTRSGGSLQGSQQLDLFPRGAAASSDARYIFRACGAARQLLRICVDKLAPGGTLPFLPSRYILWFTYAAIVLLKAIYSGAMSRTAHEGTFMLIDRLSGCMSAASTDKDHPAVRYGRQLAHLRTKLSKMNAAKYSQPPTTVSSPTRPQTDLPSGPATSSNSNTNPPAGPTDYSPVPAWPFPDLPIPVDQFPQGQNQNNNENFEFGQPFLNHHDANPGAPAGVSTQMGLTSVVPDFGGEWNADTASSNTEFMEPLDLQDFWAQFGPGEAQGGFPFL